MSPSSHEEEARCRTAEELLGEMLGSPFAAQQYIVQHPRFWSPDLLDLLLETSQAAQPEDCARSAALAVMASSLAGFVYPEMEESVGAVFFTRAAVLRGNALRILGELEEAETAFGEAAHYLTWPFESADRAGYCRALGLLRWEQGRIDEAAALLRHAARVFREHDTSREEGACLALLGIFYLEQSRPQAAVHCLQAARVTLDPEARPWLTVRAGLSLALALADLGQAGPSRAIQQETWRWYRLVEAAGEHVRISWLEGKIEARTARCEDAEQVFWGVRQKLLAEHCLPEVVFCSLDLAALLVESGRAAELPRLLRDIDETFAEETSGLDVTRRVYQAFVAGLENGRKIPWQGLGMAEITLRRVFRSRGYQVERLPFA